MTELDPTLERWRLILGQPADACLGGGKLSEQAQGRDSALDWLYGRDADLARRGVRRGGAERVGGTEESQLTTVDWLTDISVLFPKETVERLERDAIERYQIDEIVTNADALERVEPNAALLSAVLKTKHLMNPEVLALARRIVAKVVEDLMAKLATEVRSAFTGTRSRRPSRFQQARNFDVRRTLKGNLAHYDPDQRKVFIEQAYFFSRTRRHIDRWQVILLVDQSGSMVDSVIHSAVTAACLWGLPGVKTHLVAFDTAVVDLTKDVDDPVELLMKVQLGGGTDIAKAVRYANGLIENPRRTIVVLISDFFEGVSPDGLVHGVKQLVHQGSKVLGLAALDERADPAFDRAMAQRLAAVGAQVGAMTPGQLAEFVADAIGA